MEKSRTDYQEGNNGKGWPAVLDWMARIRIAGVEAVAAGLELAPKTVRTYALKLQAEGLVTRPPPPLPDGSGGMIVITPRGVREAGHETRSGTTPSSMTALVHGRGVSWIAAYCDRRGRPWSGPLELRDAGFQIRLPRRGTQSPRTHLPDLGFILDGEERWAVEFERVQKSRERLQWILKGYRSTQLAGELDSVLYVCANDEIEELVNSVADQIGLNLTTRPLDRIMRVARNGQET